MKILFLNPIIYTSESKKIKQINSIKDTMSVGMCNEMKRLGHDVTLYTTIDYKPLNDEKYEFNIIYDETKWKKIFFPNSFPYLKNLKHYLKKNKFDLIISSECFSMWSLLVARKYYKNAIIWQELADYQSFMKKIPAKIWYKVIVRFFFKKVLIVPRSEAAKTFISKFSKNISEETIGHGVNLNLFTENHNKINQFIVASQLIERKQIDQIIIKFSKFLTIIDTDYRLLIIGDGDKKESLVKLAKELKINDKVSFIQKLEHEKLVKYISESKAFLINTRQDNNMISITESIACATPVITTSIPTNSINIKENILGIVKDDRNEEDLIEIVNNNEKYIANCSNYRLKLSYQYKIELFISLLNK